MSDKVTQPGVYKSDEGHVLILRWNPTSVTCVSCAEMCSRSDSKNLREFKVKADEFTAKHGYLDDYLGAKIEDLLKAN